VRLAIGSPRLLALGSVALTGCTLFASVNGLTGGQETPDAAGSDPLTADAQSEGPSTDGSEGGLDADPDGEPLPVDSARPLDSPAEAQVDAGSVYVNAVLSDKPLAYWRVDETSGAVARDFTANGNDAHYTGGVTKGTAGALINETDTAVTLDGTTGYLDVGNRFGFTGNAPYTLEIWALPQNLDTSYQRLFSRELPTTPREGYLMFVRVGYPADPSTFSLERWSAGQTSQCPQTSAILAVWHHLVATYDGSTSRIYLDGTLAAAQPAAAPLNATSASLWIGASIFDTAGYFGGVVDEVAVYGSALSATRIAAHYHASGR
jgi:hypothetical protein